MVETIRRSAQTLRVVVSAALEEKKSEAELNLHASAAASASAVAAAERARDAASAF